jgi:hypothetical protein
MILFITTMEYIRCPPSKILRRCVTHSNNYEFNYAKLLDPYVDTRPHLYYLCSLDVYSLKNIWNHLVKKWFHTREILRDSKSFKNSKYRNINIQYTRENLDYERLDEMLIKFVSNDHALAIYVLNTIQDYVYPLS